MSIFEFFIETLHYKSKLYLTTGLTVLIGETHFLFDNMMLLQNFIRVQLTSFLTSNLFVTSKNEFSNSQI